MNSVDYIIVGLGLAGLAFAEELEKKGKSFIVFEDNSQNSSQVAAGVYNPVILKRFTQVWNAKEQLRIALPFYKNLEKKLKVQLDYKFDILRIFKSFEEQNNWFNACDKPFFSNYMVPKVFTNSNKSVIAPFGSGKLKNIGKVDIKALIGSYANYLSNKGCIRFEKFGHSYINIDNEYVCYNGIKAKKVVFCEGYGLKNNPYFNHLPLNGTKGELITIKAPKLKEKDVLKSAVFVLPLGEDIYEVGATFNWHDKTLNPTQEGKEELFSKLNKVITCDFKIIDHKAGVRPTVKDRRPLLGKHPEFSQMAILNGFGTRGVMLAPKMAKLLYSHIENHIELDKEVSIYRFYT